MALAIFDLDRTLLAGDSDFLWGEFLSEVGAVDSVVHQRQNQHFFNQYTLGKLDINAYLAFSLAPLAKYPLIQLNNWRKQFVAKKITPIILPKAQAVVNKHKQKGDTVMVITSTNDFVVEPIIKYYGIKHFLATKAEKNSSGYTGKVSGLPCFQIGKVTNLKNWLANKNIDLVDSYFYSDSHNDLPLLELVDNPIAVGADAKLQVIANERNWQRQNWQD